MSDTIIELKDIRKNYGKAQVLQGVNLEIRKGEICGLVGRNGAGKTTIFKIILGLTEFQGGTVRIGNSGESLNEGRKKIGFMVGSNLFPYMTARENLEYYRILKGVKDKHEVDRLLELVSLDKVTSKTKSFSMGMKQRLNLANAFLGNPELVILDEPTNGLDPQGIADIRHIIRRVNQEFGTTIIVSSHILGELQHTADSFAILNGGQIVKTLTAEDLTVAGNYVRLEVKDLERAKKVLEEAGIEVVAESSSNMSLEDYYFSLVGGSK